MYNIAGQAIKHASKLQKKLILENTLNCPAGADLHAAWKARGMFPLSWIDRQNFDLVKEGKQGFFLIPLLCNYM